LFSASYVCCSLELSGLKPNAYDASFIMREYLLTLAEEVGGILSFEIE